MGLCNHFLGMESRNSYEVGFPEVTRRLPVVFHNAFLVYYSKNTVSGEFEPNSLVR
jgi:hypothetical protein